MTMHLFTWSSVIFGVILTVICLKLGVNTLTVAIVR